MVHIFSGGYFAIAKGEETMNGAVHPPSSGALGFIDVRCDVGM